MREIFGSRETGREYIAYILDETALFGYLLFTSL